jgi:hypothetical protein
MFPVTQRQVVYLTDEQYFCNKGWTLSFNFNTKSWVSFHSYIPNWYIGENNFFYSGINGCCDEFDALVGVLGPIPTTTTTSSTSSTSTTSTSTSTTTSTSTSTTTTTSTSSTTTTTTTLCPKAGGLVQEAFFTGYDIISPASTVVSTGSSSAACSAVSYLNSLPLPYTNVNAFDNNLLSATELHDVDIYAGITDSPYSLGQFPIISWSKYDPRKLGTFPMGRIGRNNIQQTYTLRFRDDAQIFKLFTS